MVNFFMPADHPFNPFGIDLDGSGATTGTANAPFFTKRPTRGGTAHLQPGRGHLVPVRRLRRRIRRSASRTMYWDVTGIRSENNATADEAQPVQCAHAERRARRSRGLRRDARLRAAQHLRRRLADAGDARLRDLYRRRHQQPEAGRHHRQPVGRAVRPAGGRRSASRSVTSTARRTAASSRTRWSRPAKPRTCRPTRLRAATTWTSSTARSSSRS